METLSTKILKETHNLKEPYDRSKGQIKQITDLCDTMIANKPLNITEEDIVKFMIGWLDMHHIKIADLRKNS